VKSEKEKVKCELHYIRFRKVMQYKSATQRCLIVALKLSTKKFRFTITIINRNV